MDWLTICTPPVRKDTCSELQGEQVKISPWAYSDKGDERDFARALGFILIETYRVGMQIFSLTLWVWLNIYNFCYSRSDYMTCAIMTGECSRKKKFPLGGHAQPRTAQNRIHFRVNSSAIFGDLSQITSLNQSPYFG
jgi:hypothetical protein